MPHQRPSIRWLEQELWTLAIAAIGLVAVGFVLAGVLGYRTPMPLGYLVLSRTGVLTTARIERFEGYSRPSAVYAYTSADGVKRYGRAPRPRGDAGETLLVYYLPGDPDVSTPRVRWFELEQLAIAVLLVAACGTSLVARSRRS